MLKYHTVGSVCREYHYPGYAGHANDSISPIFDREKEQQRLQQAQLIGEIGNLVAGM